MLPIFGSIRKLNSSQLADFCCKRRPQDYERIAAIGLDDLDVCPLLNAAAIDAYPSADALLRNPTTGMVDCCARRERPYSGCPDEKYELASTHSITLSALTRNDSAIVSPRAFAVLRFITSSNLVGCSIGRSAGFAPRKRFAANRAARSDN